MDSIVVVYRVVETVRSETFKFTVVEDMQQGRLTSETEDSRRYCNKEEVLVEFRIIFVVFPPFKLFKIYEVAERKHLEKKHFAQAGMKEEEDGFQSW